MATGKMCFVAIRCCKKVASSLFVNSCNGLFQAALHLRIKLVSHSESTQGPIKSATDVLMLFAAKCPNVN